MNLHDAFAKLFSDSGIEIDSDALDEFGDPEDEVNLGDPLPGKAAGAVEIFLAAPSTQIKSTVDGDGLIWTPIMYENQWALRPDGRGGKKRVPLKIVAGHSKNQRREIGLADIKAAFDDKAIENVTVPETHENRPTENHGYIESLKIGKVKLDDGKTVTALMAGMDIKIPETKRKMELGAVAGRSAGLLYDYERTDTGKSYPVVLEHTCLTSRQWLRGMPRFGRKLAMLSDDVPIASLTLSDEGPTDEEYTRALADTPDDEDFLADTAKLLWPQEESPEWLKGQVNAILDARRAEKRAARSSSPMYVEESYPYYRAKDAKPGEALICDGYGDGANHWIAPITVNDGQVEISDFTKWQSVDQAWVADSTDTKADDSSDLSEEKDDEVIDLSGLQLAQKARADRTKEPNNEPPRGGGKMAGENTNTLQLSDEARAMIKAAEDRASAAEKKAEKLSQSVDSLITTANANRADAFITELKGMGLDEEHGFTGMLNEVHQVMLADDGGPAIQSDHFSDDRNKTGELTISDAFRRVFGALKTAEGVTLKLGEVVTPPSEKLDESDDTGKPPKGDESRDEFEMSDAELLALQEKDHPGTLAAAGIKQSGNGKVD